ncbi:GDP-mannose-dependent alpha-(1-6)-phosphatidylinositol monomannoside mannosyltransferase [Anaerolineales bacterium]|nr:GDP-mannose-dependent alpha-(1-6)-phosphatidylinositol monomannoside mannosyltransferase [Anaerolineales bacterium]
MRQKITHVVRLFELYGIGNHLLSLLPSLAKNELDVELIALVRQQPSPVVLEGLKKMEASGVRVTILPLREKLPSGRPGFTSIERTIDLVRLFRERKDRIIHIHLEYFGMPIALWLAGCKKVVMSIHSDDKWFMSYKVRTWLHIIDRIIGRYISVSDRVREYYAIAANIDPRKIERIYHGINYIQGKNREFVRKKYNMPADKFVFGIVGRLTHEKNIELLIEAARKLPNTHCVIAGDGELRDMLRRQANGLSNVQFLGFQPDGYELMPGFDLFCLPSRFEGLGLVLIEAMLQGVPIAGSRAGAIPEILGDGKYGLLFDSNDLDGLTSSIEYAMNNRSAILDTAIRAQQYAQATFSVQKMTDQTIRVYKTVEL